MKTTNDQISEVRRLRASIGILTRGGPVTINMVQDTNPVLLQGTELPAEASYVFMNPINGQGSYKNSPVSIELFFGENGRENEDITLGKFQLKDILPVYAGSRKIEMKLAVSAAQILSITLLDHTAQKYRSIAFIDISDLEPPETVPVPKTDPADQGKFLYEELSDTFLNAKLRETGIPRHGKDITQELTISFDEALHGAEKNIEAISTETCPECAGSGAQVGKTAVHCPDCQGTGWKEEKQTDKGPAFRFTNCPTCDRDGLIIMDPCRNCQGKTWVKTKRSIRLRIPACIDSGAEVCLLHQGEPGRYGGLAGHLRIAVNIAAHPFLTRTGRDISIHLPVSASLAREGGHLRVPGLEKGSFFLMSLPSGSKNDMTFKVFESDDYILTARIETYQPALLFALPNIKKHLQAIHAWLGNAEYELSGQLNDLEVKKDLITSEEGRNEKTRHQTTQAMVDSTLAPGRSPNQAEFYTRRGMVYAEKGNRERAMADYNKALELDPNYAGAYDSRSVLYISQKDHGKALADINRAVELEPNDAEYYFHRGMLYHFQENIAMAMADYDKALELDPNNADFYESRGRLNTLKIDAEAAISDFSKALELDPNNADIYYRRGTVYRFQKEMTRTLTDYTRALELDPNNNSVLFERSQVYMLQNDLENALIDINKVAEKKPNNAGVYNNRGYIYLLKNDLDNALVNYNKALELDSKLVPAYNYRGKTYLMQTHYRQAIEDFNKSLLLHPGDIYPYLWLGQAYQGLGEKEKAIASYRKVLKESQNPELCQEAQKYLADLGIG